MRERTFAMIKPDAVKANQIGGILHLIQHHDLDLIGLRMTQLSDRDAQMLYAEHHGRPYYDNLLAFTTSGPVVLLVLEGPEIIRRFRHLMGATNPIQAEPFSIRAVYGTGMPNNAIHSSDSPEAAAREIALFFSERELCPLPLMTSHASTSMQTTSSAA